MEQPLQIAFRDFPRSEAVEADIRGQAAELEQFYERIQRCRVVVEMPHRRHQQGKLYTVRIDLTVPGQELVIGREPSQHHAHEDVYVAIRDAFNAAKRQLQDHARRERADVKRHEAMQEGRVAKLFPEPGYGFIETADGREVYFHRNSVLDGGFDQLVSGARVRFAEELGEKGPQASTVHPGHVRRRTGAGRTEAEA